jgi:hypothetical protein
MKIILSICNPIHLINSNLSKKKTFKNLYDNFAKHEFFILGDDLSNELEKYILSFDNIKFFENKLRGKNQYFIDKLNFIINNFNNDDNVYLAEDDYAYANSVNCDLILQEGLEYADYTTLYDCPDKYIQCKYRNPKITDTNIGENTVLFRTKNSHWKYTNSTTGTFACKKKTLKEDYNIFLKSFIECPLGWWDYIAFKNLRSKKNRKIASCIPGQSSHLLDKELHSPFFKMPI